MQKFNLFILTVISGLVLSIGNVGAQNTMTKMDSLSYSLGLILAQNLKQQGFNEVNTDALALGVRDVLENNPHKINMEDANAIITSYLRDKKAESAKPMIEEGMVFLAENAKRPEVTTTASGLQYEVITKIEDGPRPSLTDTVKTHYEGMLLDGTVFDSSYKRGEPATFPLNGVIKGWQEVIQLMPVGSIWKVYIPYDLAYGEQGAGGAIPPYATLIFKIELLDIE